jgi:hypothetical protein
MAPSSDNCMIDSKGTLGNNSILKSIIDSKLNQTYSEPLNPRTRAFGTIFKYFISPQKPNHHAPANNTQHILDTFDNVFSINRNSTVKS